MTNDLLKRAEGQELSARQFGFYWKTLDQVINQVRSECAEVLEAYQSGDRVHLQGGGGDLLHAALAVCVFFGFRSPCHAARG